MMSCDNFEVVRQHQVVVASIRERELRKLRETKANSQLTVENVNCFAKLLITVEIILMKIAIIIIIIIIMIAIIV